MLAPKLNQGDEIRVIAPSRSLAIVRDEIFNKALCYLEQQGFHVTFSKHSREKDDWNSSSIQRRVPINAGFYASWVFFLVFYRTISS